MELGGEVLGGKCQELSVLHEQYLALGGAGNLSECFRDYCLYLARHPSCPNRGFDRRPAGGGSPGVVLGDERLREPEQGELEVDDVAHAHVQDLLLLGVDEAFARAQRGVRVGSADFVGSLSVGVKKDQTSLGGEGDSFAVDFLSGGKALSSSKGHFCFIIRVVNAQVCLIRPCLDSTKRFPRTKSVFARVNLLYSRQIDHLVVRGRNHCIDLAFLVFYQLQKYDRPPRDYGVYD